MVMTRGYARNVSEQVQVLRDRVRLLEECLVENDKAQLTMQAEANKRAARNVPLCRWKPGIANSLIQHLPRRTEYPFERTEIELLDWSRE